MKTKKLSYKSQELLEKLIQKELDLHNVKFEYIASLQHGVMPNGEMWYVYFTFKTENQYQEWKQYCIDELRNTKERLSKKRAKELFKWIDLNYGLRHEFEKKYEVTLAWERDPAGKPDVENN